MPFRVQRTTKNLASVPDASRLVKSATESLRDAPKNPDNLKKAGDAISDLVRKK